MPSTMRHTTAFGSGRATQPAASMLFRAKPAANEPAVISLQKVNDSGTVTNQFLWFDHQGRLRTHTSYPTNQDSDGRDITASLAIGSIGSVDLGTGVVSATKIGALAVMTSHLAGSAVTSAKINASAVQSSHIAAGAVASSDIASNTVTPGLLSASSREMYIPVPLPSLSQGTDVSNRVIYRTTAVTTLNRGSAFIRFDRALGGPISTNSVTIGLGVSAAFDLFTRTFTTTQAAGSLTSLTAGSAATVPVSTNVRLDITTAANLTFPAGQILWLPQKRGSN